MKRAARKLSLHRETVRHLDPAELHAARGAQALGTLTYEGGCEDTWNCPPPDPGCPGSTVSCTR
ncbi:MAG TPA: hypothetical protein VF173_04300 [Thermoanaerobaculia bacterium]|nr:hypothetical protein [Thermoanaerobaculia bacterium]